MKFKSIASPEPSKGVRYTGPKITVPNQSLSLEEILRRFTRGEPLEVGRDVNYHEGTEDLEKMAHMDLVDRAEYVEKLRQTQKDYEKQEKTRFEKQKADILAAAVAADKKAFDLAVEAQSKVKP